MLLATANFFLPRAMPGDPVSSALAANANLDDDSRTELARYYQLDRPVAVQYVQYLGRLARGDLGVSIRYNTPVSRVIGERLPWTLLLVSTAAVMATVVGVLAGVHSGWRRGRRMDKGLLSVFLTIRNLPVFFVASLALYVFAVKLGWAPIAGAVTPFAESWSALARVADISHHLFLPASVLAIQFTSLQYLAMRAGIVGELGSDYLLLGRAKGLIERRLKYRYAARNALLPVVSVTALQVGLAMSSALFVETVFAYPGMGRLTFEAVGARDYPLLHACFLAMALLVLTANFLADSLYARLDPRKAA